MTSKTDKENVDEITECPDCKSTHLKRDYDHAEIVCADCGLVLEDNIGQAPGRPWPEGQAAGARC